MAAKAGQRRWGHIRKLDSGRFQASYIGPDLRRYNGPRPFDSKLMAKGWLARERELIQLAAYNGTRWTSPTERDAKAAVRGETMIAVADGTVLFGGFDGVATAPLHEVLAALET
jgi:outer membrane protein assembly factor BamB